MPKHRTLPWLAATAALLCVTLFGVAPQPAEAAPNAGALRFPETPKITKDPVPKYIGLPRHSFGVMEQNAEVSAAIPFENTGKAKIEGIIVKSGCSCFGVTLSATELAPGARGTLTVRFLSGANKGTTDKPIKLLYTIAGKKELAQLQVEAKVVAGVLVERVWFGQARAGSKPTASAPVTWFRGEGKPFEITKIDVPGPKLSTRIEPWKAKSAATPYKGWTVHYTFEEPAPRGVYSVKAVLHTTHPEHPKVVVPLSGRFQGNLWTQNDRVYLGLVPQGAERQASVKVKPGDPKAPPLKALDVKARHGKVRVAIGDAFDPFTKAHKVVTVVLPADAPVGPVDEVLELRVPGSSEVTEIRVLGRVYKAQGPR